MKSEYPLNSAIDKGLFNFDGKQLMHKPSPGVISYFTRPPSNHVVYVTLTTLFWIFFFFCRLPGPHPGQSGHARPDRVADRADLLRASELRASQPRVLVPRLHCPQLLTPRRHTRLLHQATTFVRGRRPRGRSDAESTAAAIGGS